jgi:hypothetical protein
MLPCASTVFESHQSISHAGVLVALPALISQGLLKATQIYQPLPNGYYGIVHVLLLLAYMNLWRLRNPEQLKQCSPGELGKVMGLDRVPEVKCLRKKINQIVSQNKADQWQQQLAAEWIEEQACAFFYVDGHVRIYHGYKAQLNKTFVSRQKLCLSGTTEYWINDMQGMPFISIISDLNEHLTKIIRHEIVPQLIRHTTSPQLEAQLQNNPLLPRFTLIFDRAGYDLKLFQQLWEEYRIAIITYRKNVREKWDAHCFKAQQVKVIQQDVVMRLCEQTLQKATLCLREIRKLSDDGHQTSIITTHPLLDLTAIAGQMFSRWSQENFFQYMIYNFDFDKMAQYGTQPLSENIQVVNPAYSRLCYRIKKTNEKQARLQAKLYQIIEQNSNTPLETVGKLISEQSSLHEQIENYKTLCSQLREQRATTTAKITIKQMPQEQQYNALKKESKLFLNTIKMIAYRAETALVNLIKSYYSNSGEDGRMLLKQIFSSASNIEPDYKNGKLYITLHALSTPRYNKALEQLCIELNNTQTEYPGTNLILQYKIAAQDSARSQES